MTQLFSRSWRLHLALVAACWAGATIPAWPVRGQVLITEFMAANRDTLSDEDGESTDWIELHNSGSNTVGLAAWFLTDNTNNLAKWAFPDVVLAPDEYLVIFASEKDRAIPGAQLHTNFRLDNDGEYLALVDSATNVVSDFSSPFPPQQTDVSFGRDRLEPLELGYFLIPTPGGPNTTSGSGFAPEVVFSRPSGTFSDPFTLTLSSGTTEPDVVIRYTLNGSLPTNGAPVYSGGLEITNSLQVRARAFREGYLPGPPGSALYFMLGTNALAATSDLPIILLHTLGGGPANEIFEKFVAMAVFMPKFGVSSLTNAPDFVTRARFKVRGSSTAGIAKSSWSVEAWDEFNDDRDIELLGMPAESDWVFYAPNRYEPVLIHNPFAHDLSRRIGRYSPRTRFAEVYYHPTAGAVMASHYHGLYVIEEKIKIGPDRVDIAPLRSSQVHPPEVTGGYLLKIDRPDPGDTGFAAAGQTILYVDPKEAEIELPQRDAQEQYIRDYFNAFGQALNSTDYTDPTNGYAAYIDVGSWIDHHILNVLTFNVDALRLSGYFHKPREGRITMGPLWDFDRALGSTDGRDLNPRVWRSQTGDLGTDFWNYPWWGRLFTDPDFFQRWIDRYQELRRAEMSNEQLLGLVNEFPAQVLRAQPRDQARWRVAPRPRSPQYEWTTKLDGTYQGEVDALKAWLLDRTDFMDTNFLAAPVLNHAGGEIEAGLELGIAGPPGATIYYTLDGTDPRARQGLIAPGALVYGTPIRITENARVMARAYHADHRNLTGPNNPPLSSPWSGPIAATYVVTRPPLIVTELMYHPQPEAEGFEADEFEFLELMNIGPTALDLSGFRFTSGIEFDFSTSAITQLGPGQRLLVVKNLAAFSSRYGFTTGVAGEYRGNLANNGERIYLEGPLREPVMDFTYSDEWYPLSDGYGFSLVIVDEHAPFAAWNEPAQWRLSQRPGGEPAQIDPPAPDLPNVLINEILAHPVPPGLDTIELWNPGPAPADITHWWLTDDADEPRKFRFPPDTILPPDGYLVVDENIFNPPGVPAAFALSSRGEEVWLFSADASGELTGYRHGFDFGPSAMGRTFGRYLTSGGSEHFPPLTQNSPGSTNAGPVVGPVVVTEVMYHAAHGPPGSTGFDETLLDYIELRNISEQPIALFDPQDPFHQWRLTDAVEFSFPIGSMLGPGVYALVVGFDPANLAHRQAFESAYDLPEGMLLFGPYEGKLDNAGDRVELRRPAPPSAPPSEDAAEYLLVDRVDYRDGPPWPPVADGLGPSLQRVLEPDYGNDVINWMAAHPTPGSGYEGGLPPVVLEHPTDLIIVSGQEALLSVTAQGPPPLRYQWRQNGAIVAGGTEATLLLTNVQPSQAGIYSVVVYNGGGAAASESAMLTVLIPATIVRPPQSVLVPPGSGTSFTVGAVGSGSLHYQWFYFDEPIPDATNSSLVFTNIQLDHAGSYQVLVTNELAAARSQPVTLQVEIRPYLIEQPGPALLTALEGDLLTLRAVAGPEHWSLPLSFRWRRDGVYLPEQTNATLSMYLTNQVAPNAQSYTNRFAVLYSNPVPLSTRFSSNVVVIVQADRDGDGVGDLWELRLGLNPADPKDGLLDLDEDGLSNRAEFRAGTDPADRLSSLRIEQRINGEGARLLEFNAVGNQSYSVQWREAPDRGRWRTLANLGWRLTNWLATAQDPYPPALGRLYRVVTPQTGEAQAPGPVILSSPAPAVVNAGESAEFSVWAVGSVGSEPLAYQWYLGDHPLSGEQGAVLRWTAVQTNQHGLVSVEVSDALGSVRSDSVWLTVLVAPQLLQEPRDEQVRAGGSVALAVEAVGYAPLSYFWEHNGSILEGETNAVLALENVQINSAGTYSVWVSHTSPTGQATVRSRLARVEILP